MPEQGYCVNCQSVHDDGELIYQCLRCYHFICANQVQMDNLHHEVKENGELCGPVSRLDNLVRPISSPTA